MSLTASIITKKIQDLSSAIGMVTQGNPLEEKSRSEFLTTPPENILKTFMLSQQRVIFTWNEGGLQVFVEQKDGKQSMMSLEDVEGIPKEILISREKAEMFLSACNLSIPKYLEEDKFTIRLNLSGLKGGGNIAVGGRIHYWPVKIVNGRPAFVIPYKLEGSPEAEVVYNGEKTSYAQKLHQAIQNGTARGKALQKELGVLQSMQKAIELWNATGLVQLVPWSGDLSEHRVKLTTNSDGVCESLCTKGVPGIGMCPSVEEQAITCDLEGKFHSNSLQSVLHEIGHVIGLRHEHAREDRDTYINTNLSETSSGCEIVGTYDLYSVMHYEIGEYPSDDKESEENDFLQLKDEPFDFIVKNCPTAKAAVLKEKAALKNTIGKTPAISNGDKEAVEKLIVVAREKEAAQQTKKAEAARKSLETLRLSAGRRRQSRSGSLDEDNVPVRTRKKSIKRGY